jgi:hypothetical protein
MLKYLAKRLQLADPGEERLLELPFIHGTITTNIGNIPQSFSGQSL